MHTDVLEDVFALSNEEIQLEDTLLDLSQKAQMDLLGQGPDLKDVRDQLDNITEKLRRWIEDRKDHKEVIEILNNYLFGEYVLQVDRARLFESNLDVLLIPQVLLNKKGQCLSLSLIYLILAEKLDLPVQGVMYPGHFFVRYQDGEDSLNIETTAKGKDFDEAYYQSTYLKNFDDRISGRMLSKKETIAVYLSNLANQYKLQGYHKKAVEIFKTVIPHFSARASVYVNLGNAYERDGQIIKAIITYQKALQLNPYLCEAHYNLGLIHFLYTKRYSDARRHGEVAQKLGCRMHPQFRDFLNRKSEKK